MTTGLNCDRCGEPINAGARFCMKCGADVSGVQGAAATAMLPAAERDEHEILLELLKTATLGDYEILTELGRGGMATVYLAHDIALDRKVAIKVMAPALLMMGEGMVERFKREARTSASLSHPNIIPIYGVKGQGKTLYFIMKFIAGRSLESIIRDRGAMPIAMARAVLHQVGSALGYAHRRGVVHRDVKPANIMIDEEGWAVVTDFGIAKVAESRGLTMTGIAVGTPSYMSPEQCAAKDITGKSDQYSLGVVAYEMLTGKQPFEADSAMAIMFAHFNEKPKPIQELRADCPPAIAAAVMRMLEKGPDARWGSMEEAMAAIGTAALGHDDPIRLEMVELAKRGTARLKLDAVPPPPSSPAPPARPSDKTTPIPLSKAISVAITPASFSLMVGESMQLTATPRAGGGTAVSSVVSWTSRDPKHVSVSPSGLVTALTPGAATITATCDEVNATATVTVTPVPVASVGVAPAEKRLHPGESADLEVVVRDARDSVMKDQAVSWKSESPEVASVSSSGRVTAVKVGAARITASVEGKLGAATIHVVPVPVATVTIAPVPAVVAGETAQLAAALKDAKGNTLSGRTVTWSSSDAAIATVAPSGLLSAIAAGQVTVSAESEGQRGSVGVTVKPPPVGSVTVEPPPQLIVGDTVRLKAVVKDARGNGLSGRETKWSSAAPKIASVTTAGVVTGIGPGGTKISAECEGKTWTVSVTVIPIPVDRVTLAGLPASLKAGESAKAIAAALDAKGSGLAGREITWTSSDTKVLAVGKDGTVTGKTEGAATITASCEGKRAEATIRVVVPPAPKVDTTAPTMAVPVSRPQAEVPTVLTPSAAPRPEVPRVLEPPVAVPVAAAPVEAEPRKSKTLVLVVIGVLLAAGGYFAFRGKPVEPVPAPAPLGPAPVASVAISVPERDVTVGRTLQLTARISDSSGTELNGRALTWTTSDAAVADVSPSGAVTVKQPGSVTITAASGGRNASATLLAVAPQGHEPAPVAVASILLGPNPSALEPGGTAILRATPRDDRGTPLDDRPVVWTSSDPAVATVSSSGVVTGVAPGTATIMASSEAKSAQVRVTVNAPRRPEPPAPATVAAVALGTKAQTVKVGESYQLTALAQDAGKKTISNPAIVWASSDPKVATVSLTGLITPLAEGTTTITATAGGKSASAKITVPAPPETRILAASVALTPAARSLKVGETATWSAAARDAKGKDLSDHVIAWNSSAPQVATVSAGGLITGVTPGSAEISASTDGKSTSASITIVAAAAPPAPPLGPATSSLLPKRGIAAGGGMACGVTSSGAAVCWGGARGGIGAMNGVSNVTQLSVGTAHACAISGGQAFCWGSNKFGQIGDGSSADRPEATPVSGALAFSMISVGNQHTCGIVGTKAYCWGKNDKGQLGDGTTTDRKKPVQVRSNEAFSRISAGGGHTCALNAAGKALCWGDGWSGALGFGDVGIQSEAVNVKSDQKFTRIVTGGDHSCALSAAGKVFCWGGNKSGQVGDGSTDDRDVPVAVASSLSFDDLAAGGPNTCAIAGGGAYCWGDNKFGQVGDGSKSGRNKPAAVAGGLTFSSISVGGGYACGLAGSGDPQCWGRNDRGQLGDASTTPRASPGPVTAP